MIMDKNKYIVLIELNKNDSFLCSKNYFVFSTNTKYKKDILKRFKKFYIKINPIFFENSNVNKFFIQKIKDKIHTIDEYVIYYMKIYGFQQVRGGSYINRFIESNIYQDIIRKYTFCEICEYGINYCICPHEPQFLCDCCYKTQYFFTKEELNKHQIEIGKKEKIIERKYFCTRCRDIGHFEENCNNFWPYGKLLQNDYYSSDSD